MTIDDIEKSQEGDRDSTLLLIEKFNPLLRKYAYKLSYEDAYNDLLVDFIELIHNIKLTRIYNKEEGGIISYICASMHNSYVKRLIEIKKLRIILLYSDLSDSELYYIESLTSTNDTYPKIQYDVLKKHLTSSEFNIIKMLYYLDYSATETANICGISRQAVNQTKNRALKKLKRVYLDKPRR